MNKQKVISLEDRIPKIKQHRKRKKNRRLLLLFTLFLLLIISVVYFQSSLSKVQKIKVQGTELVQDDELIHKSGIKKGDNIWGINRNKIEKKLSEEPEIKSADVKVLLPNKISISIKEFSKEAYLEDGDSFHIILDNGKIIKNNDHSINPIDAPLLRGFKEGATLVDMIQELKELPTDVQHLISEISLQPTKTDPLHLSLYMNDGYEVSATIRTFSEKMKHYPSIVSQLDHSKKGIIDLEVGSYFRSYQSEGE